MIAPTSIMTSLLTSRPVISRSIQKSLFMSAPCQKRTLIHKNDQHTLILLAAGEFFVLPGVAGFFEIVDHKLTHLSRALTGHDPDPRPAAPGRRQQKPIDGIKHLVRSIT